VPDWLAFTLLTVAWTPPLVLLHELAHGVTALIVTDGEVTIGLERAGLRGGWASYDRAAPSPTSGRGLDSGGGCALPTHYGAGLGGWGESDGRVFLRVLNGG
jgi:hypothetical protein